MRWRERGWRGLAVLDASLRSLAWAYMWRGHQLGFSRNFGATDRSTLDDPSWGSLHLSLLFQCLSDLVVCQGQWSRGCQSQCRHSMARIRGVEKKNGSGVGGVWFFQKVSRSSDRGTWRVNWVYARSHGWQHFVLATRVWWPWACVQRWCLRYDTTLTSFMSYQIVQDIPARRNVGVCTAGPSWPELWNVPVDWTLPECSQGLCCWFDSRGLVSTY